MPAVAQQHVGPEPVQDLLGQLEYDRRLPLVGRPVSAAGRRRHDRHPNAVHAQVGGSAGDRLWQPEPIASTLAASGREELPETRATLVQFCPILHIGGLCAVSLAIRSD